MKKLKSLTIIALSSGLVACGGEGFGEKPAPVTINKSTYEEQLAAKSAAKEDAVFNATGLEMTISNNDLDQRVIKGQTRSLALKPDAAGNFTAATMTGLDKALNQSKKDEYQSADGNQKVTIADDYGFKYGRLLTSVNVNSNDRTVGFHHFGMNTQVRPKSGTASYTGKHSTVLTQKDSSGNPTTLSSVDNPITATVDFANGSLNFSTVNVMFGTQAGQVNYSNVNLLGSSANFSGSGVLSLNGVSETADLNLSGGLYGPNAEEMLGVGMGGYNGGVVFTQMGLSK